MTKVSTTLLAVGASTIAAFALILSTSGVAAAHVGLSGTATAAGASSILTFTSSHGCDGSPTTEVAIQIPTQLNAATPTQLAGWDVQKVMQNLDAPVPDGRGNQITERVDQIVYTAKEPLADGIRVAFEVAVTLPENAADTTLHFPTLQRCAQGQNDWIEIPASGQDPHELDAPAPSLTVTAATEGSHGGDTAQTMSTGAGASSSGNALSIAALAAGVAGVLLGGLALLRGRSRV